MASTQAQGHENRKADESRRLLRTPQAEDAAVAQAFEPLRVYGNRALGGEASPAFAADPAAVVRRARLVVQPKLTLGPVDDVYEREADSVAAQVVQSMAATQAPPVQRQEDEEELQMKAVQRQEVEEELQMKPAAESVQRQEDEEELQMKPAAEAVQRQEDEEELQMKPAAESVQRAGTEEEEEPLQGKRTGGPEAGALDPAIESQIQRARAGGSALEPAARSSMEGAMGSDFSSVRIHTGQESDSLNRSLSARAFTTGSDIFFRSGEYNPGSTQGQQLLAHELTHVVQQGAATVRTKRTARDLFFGATFA